MSSTVFGSKKFNPVAPEKGSFPLDHEGECKRFYLEYMLCLSENQSRNSACRDSSKAYLGCRMDKGLMKRESWQVLGYQQEQEQQPQKK